MTAGISRAEDFGRPKYYTAPSVVVLCRPTVDHRVSRPYVCWISENPFFLMARFLGSEAIQRGQGFEIRFVHRRGHAA